MPDSIGHLESPGSRSRSSPLLANPQARTAAHTRPSEDWAPPASARSGTPDVSPVALGPRELLFLQRNVGNRATRQALDPEADTPVPLQRAKPRRASPKTETHYDVTGRYHVSSYATTLQINSAGRHFIGWMQVRRSGKRFELSKLRGELAYTPGEGFRGTYTRSEPYLSVTGVIRPISTPLGFRLRLEEPGWSADLTRESSSPRLTEGTIGNFPPNVRELVRAREEMALTPPDRRFLDKQLRDIQILVKSYSEIGVTDRTRRRQRASQIDLKASNSLNRFAARVVPAVHQYIRNSLAALPDIKLRSAYDWLTVIATEYPVFTPHFEPVFGVKRFKAPEAGGQSHRYRIRTNQAAGAVFGFGVIGGSIDIEKLGPDKWLRTYYFAGLSMGVGVSANVKGGTGSGTVGTWAEFRRGIPYAPDDFFGPFTMTSGSIKIIGVEISDTYFNFEGDGSLPVLTVPTGPVGAGFAGFGIELIRATGRVFGTRKEALRWAKAQRRITAEAVEVTATGANFGVDDAELTDAARQNLRRFCALNRAVLESPDTRVDVLAYTSTTASTDHNKKLSDLRAANTVQALRDLLGEHLKARLAPKGMGEEPARQEDDDNVENPKWRKVEITVNGRLATTLWF